MLEIRFTKPLERFRTVRIELTEGILGTDQQPLVPWTLSFVDRRKLRATKIRKEEPDAGPYGTTRKASSVRVSIPASRPVISIT